MYTEDLAFFMGLGFFLMCVMFGYLIVEVNVIKTMFIDHEFYTFEGRCGCDADTDD